MKEIEKGYSLKQISDEIGISKMKVYRFVKANHINERYTSAQTKYYDESVRKLIIKEFKGVSNDTCNDTVKRLDNDELIVVDLLKKQIEHQEKELERKNEQIGNKDKQLEKMQELLSQQQQLSLQDKKTIQKYEEENKDLQKLIELNKKSIKEVESKTAEEVPIEKTDKKQWWKRWII